MACYYCLIQGISAPDAGGCDDCSKNVCVHPNPARYDPFFHGEQCGCGCKKLLCEQHFGAHAGGHGNPPNECFPLLTGLISGDAFVAAIGSLAQKRIGAILTEPASKALNRYLNLVSPGRGVLTDLAARRGMDAGADHAVVFPHGFFDEPALQALVRETAQAVGHTWPRVERSASEAGWILPTRVAERLAEWVRTEDPRDLHAVAKDLAVVPSDTFDPQILHAFSREQQPVTGLVEKYRSRAATPLLRIEDFTALESPLLKKGSGAAGVDLERLGGKGPGRGDFRGFRSGGGGDFGGGGGLGGL